jgi:hypothetical protein
MSGTQLDLKSSARIMPEAAKTVQEILGRNQPLIGLATAAARGGIGGARMS